MSTPNAHAADAGPSAALSRIKRDAIEKIQAHCCKEYRGLGGKASLASASYFSWPATAALTKPLKSGCGALGLDWNSGWNWQATNQG